MKLVFCILLSIKTSSRIDSFGIICTMYANGPPYQVMHLSKHASSDIHMYTVQFQKHPFYIHWQFSLRDYTLWHQLILILISRLLEKYRQ